MPLDQPPAQVQTVVVPGSFYDQAIEPCKLPGMCKVTPEGISSYVLIVGIGAMPSISLVKVGHYRNQEECDGRGQQWGKALPKEIGGVYFCIPVNEVKP